MNITKVIQELKEIYPKKRIVLNDRNNCTEILCEIDPTGEHPTHSKAVAVIDRTKPHYHNNTTETYTVHRGLLTLKVDGKVTELNEGESMTILPGQVHEAMGNETWVVCESKPGWKQSDHLSADIQS